MADRDRDEAGRARSSRPRDATGRPLEPGQIGVPRVPEGLKLTPAQALAQAEHYLAEDLPFQAHEVFEDQWKQRRAAGEADTALWQGLAQICVGLTHLQRGNAPGAATLLRRGAESLAPFADGPASAPIAALAEWAGRAAGRVAAGAPIDAVTPLLRELHSVI